MSLDTEWWKTAIQKELDAFDALGMMPHDHTPEDLAATGSATQAPVRCETVGMRCETVGIRRYSPILRRLIDQHNVAPET